VAKWRSSFQEARTRMQRWCLHGENMIPDDLKIGTSVRHITRGVGIYFGFVSKKSNIFKNWVFVEFPSPPYRILCTQDKLEEVK